MSKDTNKSSKKRPNPVSQVRNMEVIINLPRVWFEQEDEKESNYELAGDIFEEWCRTFCYNYVFQIEDSGLGDKNKFNPHIQATVRLKDKKRPMELVSLIYEILGESYSDKNDYFDINKVTCQPTVRFNMALLNYKYCSKSLTRIYGPRADETMLLQTDIPGMERSWQKFLIEFLNRELSRNSREILNVYDPYGGCGKTTFQKWWYFFADSSTGLVDFSGSLGQVLSATVNAGPKANYFINLPWKVRDKTPREKEKLGELGSAMESIKDGFLSTSYYGEGKTLCFSSPRVVVFSNTDIRQYNLFAPNRLSTIIIDENGSDFSIYRELGNHPDLKDKDSLEKSRLHKTCLELEYEPFDPIKQLEKLEKEKEERKEEAGRDSDSAKDSSSSPPRRVKAGDSQ